VCTTRSCIPPRVQVTYESKPPVVPHLETLQTQFYDMHASALENVPEKEARPATDSQHRGGSHVAARWAHEKPALPPSTTNLHVAFRPFQVCRRSSYRRLCTAHRRPLSSLASPSPAIRLFGPSVRPLSLSFRRRRRWLDSGSTGQRHSRPALQSISPRAPVPSPVLSCLRPVWMRWDGMMEISYSCTSSHVAPRPIQFTAVLTSARPHAHQPRRVRASRSVFWFPLARP
jgi:hypothetical protein